MKQFLLVLLLCVSIGSIAQYQFTNYTTFNTGDNTLGSNTIRNIVEHPINHHFFYTSYDVIMEYNGTDFIPRYDIFDPVLQFSYTELIFIDFDPNGNLWVVFLDTLKKYDGINISTYIIPQANAQTTCMGCDSQGNVWVGKGAYGLFQFDGISFSHYTTSNGLSGSTAKCLFEDNQNNLWAGTNQGVSKFDGTSWTSYGASDGIVWNSGGIGVASVGQDANGTIWVGGSEGIAEFNGYSWTVYDPSVLLDTIIENYAVSVIQNDTVNGRLWFGANQQGLFYLENSQWYKHTETEGLPSNQVRCSHLDTQNRLWFGLEAGGLCKYENATWTYITTSSGLAENWIYDISESADQEIWAATVKGTSRFDLNNWTNYFTRYEDTKQHTVKPDFDQNMCMKNDNYFYRCGSNGWDTIYVYAVGGGDLDFLSEASDEYWGAGGGVAHFHGPDFWLPSNWVGYHVGLPNTHCEALERDSSGTLWVGTFSGIAYMQGNIWVPQTIPNDDFGDWIWTLRNDLKGNLWICSDYGVACKTDTSWQFYFESDGLADNFVWDVEIASDSTLWFATIGGVSVLTDTGFFSIKESDGLVHRHARCLEQDHQGNMWIGTQHGISKLHNAIPILSTNEVENDFQVSLYPNPTKDYINIDCTLPIGSNQGIHISIYDVIGKIVREERTMSFPYQMNIQNLNAGVHFLQIDNGTEKVVRKVVKR